MKIGVVASLESQRSDNKIHQNLQSLVYFCSLIIVLRFLNQFFFANKKLYRAFRQ